MDTILEVKNLKKTFYKGNRVITAVDDISFSVKRGECLGLVGESGCGKSTAARVITNLTRADSGKVLLNGKETLGVKGKQRRDMYRQVQMIVQSPQDSFDPRWTLGDGIMESMKNNGMSLKDAKRSMQELLQLVELDAELAGRYPHQASGGQCQRAAVARALAPNPALIICDEITSALDVTVQAQIVELLKKLQRNMGVSYLFICHDLALVQAVCDRVLVMYEGRIVEEGTPDDIIRNPKEEYTKMLIDSLF